MRAKNIIDAPPISTLRRRILIHSLLNARNISCPSRSWPRTSPQDSPSWVVVDADHELVVTTG
jgi:hypothetical protein